MKTIAFGAVLAAGLVLGSTVTYLWLRHTPSPPAAMSGAAARSAAPDSAPSGASIVTLTPEAMARAHIRVEAIAVRPIAAQLLVPGTIEANGYKEVVVKALAAGRLTSVAVELGTPVRRGTILAELYSPELSEAERAFVAAAAALSAHDRQLARTERLVLIGAASQQELEQAHAEHTAMTSALDNAQARLELLGVPAEAIARLRGSGTVSASISLAAPIDGVVTTREANVGLNVDAGAPLFTIVDLSTVWAVGSVFERDAAAVRVGSRATVRIAGTNAARGTVAYVDPRVNADTRATQVRVEIPNPDRTLRLGMYADIVIDAGADRSVAAVPARAIQTVGSGPVVYVEEPGTAGRFIERRVQLGADVGEFREIVSGVSPGDRVVVDGSFFVRAERERVGGSGSAEPPAGQVADRPPRQEGRVIVSDTGFVPDHLTLVAGVPARITFVRSTDRTCATEIVFPDLKMTRALPLNQEVSVEFVPARGELAFACGMSMFKGRVTVQ
jgi:cobalt-zinc-cadmium efflux system membrane fusion protein